MVDIRLIQLSEKMSARKFMNDWGFPVSSNLYFIIIYSVFLSSAFFYNVLVNKYKYIFDIELKETLLMIAILYLLLNTFTYIFSFTNTHSGLFFSDRDQDIHLNKNFNFSALISLTYWYNFKKFFKYFCFLFLPVYILINDIFSNSFTLLLFVSFFYYCFLNFSVLFTSFYIIKTINFLIKFKINVLIRSLMTIASFILALYIGYIFSRIIIGYYLHQDIKITSFTIDIYSTYIILMIIFSLTLIFIAHIYIIRKWKNRLNECGKPAFTRLTSSGNVKLIFGKLPFLKKDILHIIRSSSIKTRKLILVLTIYFFFLGAIVAVGKHFDVKYDYLIIISISFLSALTFSQLFGEALKMYLAIDAEIKYIHLFINKKLILSQVILQKFYVYIICIIIPFLIVVFYALIFYKMSIPVFIFMVVGNISIYLSYGLFLLLTTALYPKTNWEHQREIGSSKKAELSDSIFSYVLSVVITMFLISMYIFQESTIQVIYYVYSLFVCLFLIVFVLIFILYTRKFTLLEVLVNDKD